MAWVAPLDSGGDPLVGFTFFINGLPIIRTDRSLLRSSRLPQRVQGWSNVENIYTIGGQQPYSRFLFSIQYSNLAESCFGPGELSPQLLLYTLRPTPPGVASAPQVVEVTGGLLSIRLNIPVDLGGAFGVTGAQRRECPHLFI